ncbi:MAG TPA: TlpA disulfide reductase family protein [Thermoleophilaceae bacterium]|nr:TlpA disulfide reductase family protein [Thermoleophilaceae bacterium]
MLLVLAGGVLLVLLSRGSDDEPEASRSADAAPARFLAGGREAFERRIAAERGKPVVVNKWASWCAPCRFEFPFLQSQERKRAGEVVFLGVNSNDNRGDAEDFLAEYPVKFPHFEDPNLEVAASFDAVQAFPATAYYDSKGELAFVHQGGYPSERKLSEDIERYAR